eukprot:Skav213381  [mRNA]  locus=scaffold797:235353:240535:- [translate_table: standard]
MRVNSGDIHQPLHTTNGYFNDSSRGYLPDGDLGGNRIPVVSACGAPNLHLYWDSGACEYLHNWSPEYGEREALTKNASALIAEHPKQTGQGSQNGQKAFDACQQVFVHWVNDTFDIGVAGAYHGISRNEEIQPEYAVWAKELARQQIVLGGYRLGDYLRLVATQGAKAPPRTLPVQSGWDDTTKIFATLTFVFGGLLLVLTLFMLRLRRKISTTPREFNAEFQAVQNLRGSV